jgi:hypothetical protein
MVGPFFKSFYGGMSSIADSRVARFFHLIYPNIFLFLKVSSNETFDDHLDPFIVIWYIFPFLVRCTKKNLATLVPEQPASISQLCPA